VDQAGQTRGEDTMTEALSCSGVSKRFGGTHAVKAVSLDIQAGSIHALVGENGAGKSTLLGIISGRVVPDEGVVNLFGHVLKGGRPRDLKHLGLATIYQELTMYPSLSAMENVFAGQVPSARGVVNVRAMRQRYAELCDMFDVHIPADTVVRNLSVSNQQMLEIMRGVQSNARVILLDEPSAALAEHERETLHRVLRSIAAAGTTVVFVSHNLDEVLELSDTISVMRDGNLIASEPAPTWDKRRLIRAMIGRDLIVSEDLHDPTNEPLLEVEDVSVGAYVRDVSLSLRKGEIVGIWGLVGSGRTTFMRAVAGTEPVSTGRLRIAGQEVPWPKRPADSIGHGVVMVPEDRKSGLVLTMDAVENYWLGRRKGGLRGWLTTRSGEVRRVSEEVRYFGLDPRRVSEPVTRLSGGNQQKVMLTKWAGREPLVFFIDEPTRGIDVGAKAEVLNALKRLAAEGSGVVMTSSELEEVLAVSHRLLVFAGGRVVAEIDRADPRFAVEQIVRLGFQETESHDVA
jgi:ABC-type sugar transport system ATPase subunit